jgi:hypothetical protein
VTNVCVTGDGETVRKMRAKILNETPIMLVCGRIFHNAPVYPSGVPLEEEKALLADYPPF